VGDGVTEAKPKPKISWTEANQACLVAEFAWIKGLLRAGDQRDATSARKARAAIKPPAAIDRLTELFNLSGFERSVLLLCAGVEMDSELAGLCGEAQGRPPRATFGLAMALLPDPHWSALGSARPLRHFRMIELDGGAGLTSAPLRLDERILHYLAGVDAIDARLQPFLQSGHSPEWIADDHQATAERTIKVFEANPQRPPVVHFCGDDDQGQEDAATFAAHRQGWHLFTLNAEDLPAVGPDLNLLTTLWERGGQGQSRPLRQYRGRLSAPKDGGVSRVGDPHDQSQIIAGQGVSAPPALQRELSLSRRRPA
jgi:hypothetical protein